MDLIKSVLVSTILVSLYLNPARAEENAPVKTSDEKSDSLGNGSAGHDATKIESKKLSKKKKKKIDVAAPAEHPAEAIVEKTGPKESAADHKVEPLVEKRVDPSEGADMISASGKSNTNEFLVKTNEGCFNVEFQETAGTIISCTEPFPIKYTQRNCASSDLIEVGKVTASVFCENNKRIHVSFRYSKGAAQATLRVKRISDGRTGYTARYLVVGEGRDDSLAAKGLPEPEVLPLNEKNPEEAPLKTKVSGFAYTEVEALSNFGDINQNFGRTAARTGKSDITLMSNIALEFSKDRTHLNTLFEIGEIYYGGGSDRTTANDVGGNQGSRGRIIEVRNIYLSHEYSERLAIKTGLILINSDPRGWVFSDHIAAFQAEYKSDISEAMFWFGKAKTDSNRSAAGYGSNSNEVGTGGTKDYYLGATGTVTPFTGAKANLFAVERWTNLKNWQGDDGTASGVTLNGVNTNYTWLGTNLEYNFTDSLNLQLMGIANQTRAKAGVYKQQDTSYLADAKFSFSNPNSGLTINLEGLMTPGSSTGTLGGTSAMGKTKQFNSTVDNSYLLTLATSDGLDDAVGTVRPTNSTVAPLSQPEGLQVGVLTTSMSFSKKTTALLRGGWLRTRHEVGTTGSKDLGKEVDVSLLHQLTPSTQIQLDGAILYPGAAQGVKQANATLAAAKFKFSF